MQAMLKAKGYDPSFAQVTPRMRAVGTIELEERLKDKARLELELRRYPKLAADSKPKVARGRDCVEVAEAIIKEGEAQRHQGDAVLQ